MDVLRRANIFVDGFPFHLEAQLQASEKGKGGKEGKEWKEPLLLLTHFHGDSTGAFSKKGRFRILAPADDDDEFSETALPSFPNRGGKGNDSETKTKTKTTLDFSKCLYAGKAIQFCNRLSTTTGTEDVLDIVPFRTEHCRHSLGFWFPQLKTMYLGDSRVNAEQLSRCRGAVRSTGHGVHDVRWIVGDGVYSKVNTTFPSLSDAKQRLLELLQALESFDSFSQRLKEEEEKGEEEEEAESKGATEDRVVLHVVCYHSGVLHFVEDALRTFVACRSDGVVAAHGGEGRPLSAAEKKGAAAIEVRVRRSDETELLPWKPGLLSEAQRFAKAFNATLEVPESGPLSLVDSRSNRAEGNRGCQNRDRAQVPRLRVVLEPHSLGRTLARWERWLAATASSDHVRDATAADVFAWRPVDVANKVSSCGRERELLRTALERRKGHLFLSLSSLFFAVSSDPAIAGSAQCFHAGMGHWRICTSFHASQEENRRLLAAFPEARMEACPSRPLFH
jgi:hypothetical protein